jgi:hypothetical protein
VLCRELVEVHLSLGLLSGRHQRKQRWEELLAKAGLGETADGTNSAPSSCCGLPMRPKSGPPSSTATACRSRSAEHAGSHHRVKPWHSSHGDSGCSFPGCTHPAAWCDRHHILDWILGGLTDLDNLTLLCRYHHTHFLQKGWSCRINADGLPEWIPPRWIDQDQRPPHQPHINPASDGCMLNNDPTAATDDDEHSQPHDRVRAED